MSTASFLIIGTKHAMEIVDGSLSMISLVDHLQHFILTIMTWGIGIGATGIKNTVLRCACGDPCHTFDKCSGPIGGTKGPTRRVPSPVSHATIALVGNWIHYCLLLHSVSRFSHDPARK